MGGRAATADWGRTACTDFGRKYSESDVDSVTFTVGGFAGWGYVARFQAFADVLFVLLLPCRNSCPGRATHLLTGSLSMAIQKLFKLLSIE